VAFSLSSGDKRLTSGPDASSSTGLGSSLFCHHFTHSPSCCHNRNLHDDIDSIATGPQQPQLVHLQCSRIVVRSNGAAGVIDYSVASDIVELLILSVLFPSSMSAAIISTTRLGHVRITPVSPEILQFDKLRRSHSDSQIFAELQSHPDRTDKNGTQSA